MTKTFKIKATHELTLAVDEKQFAETLSYRQATKVMNGIMKEIGEMHIAGFCNINDQNVYISGFGTPEELGIKVLHDVNNVEFKEVQP